MKYLNGVLTVIAFCLVLITFAVTGLIPSAQAKGTNPNRISVPLNPDGSITVRFAKGETMDVNIDEVDGSSLSYLPRGAPFFKRTPNGAYSKSKTNI